MKKSQSSVSTPLMERIVCSACGHFHRTVLAFKCGCCGDDVKAVQDAREMQVAS